MKLRLAPFWCSSILFASVIVSAEAGQLLPPTPYLSANDSPFAGVTFSSFFLEDWEDGLLDTPGANMSGNSLRLSSTFGTSLIDSVDADDGAIDGNGNGGEAQRAQGLISFSFSPGSYPTHVGIVWTDGVNPITFEAWDQNGVSLGAIVGSHADGNFLGGTSEDRFYGAINAGGISRIQMDDPSGIEVDHLQYGIERTIPGLPDAFSTMPALVMACGVIFWFSRREGESDRIGRERPGER